MIDAIALDNDASSLEILKEYSKQVDYINLAATFNEPEQALLYLKNYPVDLLFLDNQVAINLDINFLKKINSNVLVVLTTSYNNYVSSDFNLNIVDYLSKPFSFLRYLEAAEKVKNYTANYHHKVFTYMPYIYLRADYSLIKIVLNDILYIEALQDYCKIHMASGFPLIFRITMKSLMEKLPETQFLRIHRSHIVNTEKCDKIKGNLIFINEFKINIGRIYRKNVVDFFNDKW